MRVLLDTNVILDALLQRPPWHNEADAILQASARTCGCAATVLSLATTFYVGRKIVGNESARIGIQKYLAAFTILRIDKQTLIDADGLPGGDFEDNIQIAAAVTATLDAIITRNVRDFAQSPVPAWEPAELLRRLAASNLR